MKTPLSLILLALLPALNTHAAEPGRADNLIILDAAAVANLQLGFSEAQETTFEDTVFSLGELEVLPGKSAVVSSRIPGRAVSVAAKPNEDVKKGDEVAAIESRQPGDPPPVIKLEAPISGMISKVSIVQGQPVSPDDALVEIIDLATIEAAAQVPQHLAGKLTRGQTSHISIPSLPGKVFEAKLAHIAALADNQTGTIEAAFHVENPNLLLRPGMKAEFNIVVSRREGVMSIPRAAVQGDVAERFVYIKDYELKNAFVKTPVVLGAQNDQFVEVLEGLLPGDEVVVAGAYALGFAGKGSVSLKEALDAAHGHPHGEDGSELGKDDLAKKSGGGPAGASGSGWNQLTTFFAATSAMLFLLLIITLIRGRKTAAA
ncbi:MAG TPA: efflux RND transporter periplasmic adaptor subunit [Prosthecobacter sp.]